MRVLLLVKSPPHRLGTGRLHLVRLRPPTRHCLRPQPWPPAQLVDRQWIVVLLLTLRTRILLRLPRRLFRAPLVRRLMFVVLTRHLGT